ncbi:hypothetical protein [Streptomyces sp. NPDC001415]
MAEQETYPQALDTYLHERRARLERLWRRYRPGGMFAGELVLIDLSGCLVLCERIETTCSGSKGSGRSTARRKPRSKCFRQLAVRHG